VCGELPVRVSAHRVTVGIRAFPAAVSEATVGASLSDDEGQMGLVYIQRFAYRDGCTKAVIDEAWGEGFQGRGPE
jgi:hypothetical protein